MVASAPLATHWCAPAGLLLSSHSYLNRFSKKWLLHFVGVWHQVTSSPLVIVSRPLPVPKLLVQPKPCCSMPAASGSIPTSFASPAPWVLPKLWPPAIKATVSSSFIAMRAKVSRMSLAAAIGSGLPIRPLRVDVDQTHLHGTEGTLELTVAGIAPVLEPVLLGAPVDVLIRFPDIFATATEAEGLEAHRLERDVAAEDHQVGPGNLVAVLLLDRPEQPARLVQGDVVRPAVERREALLASTAAATAVRRCGTCRRCATPCE